MNHVFLLLGSNIEPEKNIPAGLRLLSQLTQVIAVSAIYESVPVGLREQANFYNVAVLIATELDPAGIRQTLITPIESHLARQRTADKNAPRTIDLDLVLFNEEIIIGSGRDIPDPDLLKFAHVALPIAELAPNLAHPQTGEPLQQIANRLFSQTTRLNHDRPVLWKITPNDP